ncbi:MAG: polyphosphate polymerase domain-containing protein [Oscillospiraceae bacterium]|nr:polyphosphate polymerase domain-containing protein [Oscillospiraceae bacterium]
MEKAPRYRHELKYSISRAEHLALRSRLRAVMQTDPHTDSSGLYRIRSIYFDNYRDKALKEKINGSPQREKFRIRYYNNDTQHLTLEKKIKHDSLCMKCGESLDPADCRLLLDGAADKINTDGKPLLGELVSKMKTQLLRPRVLVSYQREPYVYAPGNVRITFDFNVRTTMYHQQFLEDKVSDISAADDPGDMLMEVKYDGFLPQVIEDLIQCEGVRQQSFSKYSTCRRFG